MFKVLGVDHIGIAVTDLKEVGAFWSDALGLPANGEETVAEQKVTTGFFPTPNGSEIELLAATEPASPIAKFIETFQKIRNFDVKALPLSNEPLVERFDVAEIKADELKFMNMLAGAAGGLAAGGCDHESAGRTRRGGRGIAGHAGAPDL